MKDLRWSERYAWYHFNYDHVFNYTDADFERDAREHAERGVTTIITFGETHFFFTFEQYWEDIFACIAKIVKAFHKYNIKVVEHRSYSLAGRHLTEDDWEQWNRSHKWERWPGMKEHVFTDYTIRGVKVSSMSQVDGRTGEPQVCYYRAHCLCPNNPDYMDISLYIAGRIFDLGVDGMMNDDIQYHRPACACEHCRKLFKEETGYTLPGPDGWDAFYENYDDPAYIAWKQFKVRSTTRYLDKIVELEREKGVKMLRPVYVCTMVHNGNWSNGSYETGMKYYSNYFQENFRPTVTRYGYPRFMNEALDRYARAERAGIPSMSLFYPYTPPLTYFSWALSHTWGQMYTGTVHDKDITAVERPYREFEKKHMDYLGESKKCADLAIYQSVLTRDCRPYGEGSPQVNLMTASNFSGLMTDMVLEEDSVGILSRYPMVVLNCATMLADDHIAKLRAYAEDGGTLLLIGNCGAYTDTVAKRTPNDVAAAFGMKTPIVSCGEKKDGIFTYHGVSVAFDDMRTTCCFDTADGILKSGDTVLGVEEAIGAGRILWLLPQLNAATLETTPCIEYRDREKPHPTAAPSLIPSLRKTIGAMLRAVVGKPQLTAVCDGSDLLTAAFTVEKGHVIHITNISETFTEVACEAWHDDPLLGFDGNYTIPNPIALSFAYDGTSVPKLMLYTTEREEGLELEATLSDGRLDFTVPANTFGGYAMIVIEK